MLSVVSKHTGNLQYTIHADFQRQTERIFFFLQDRLILPLNVSFPPLASVSLNLHSIIQFFSGRAKEQCTLAGYQGNLQNFLNWPIGLSVKAVCNKY